MCSTEILATYIKKLDHPMKEIRERSLQLLNAKLKLGWQLEDELSCTRKILESLLAWFQVQKPTLQCEALSLLLRTIKTKSGTYIVKELGIRKILSRLKEIKNKVEPQAVEMFDDVVETLHFLKTVESENDLIVPPLLLSSSTSSENKQGSCNEKSNDYSISDRHYDSPLSSYRSKAGSGTDRRNMSHQFDGIMVLLFPWVDLRPPDLKTIVLVEDALKIVKSTRRSCRFIRDVFIRDFPAEVFLNRSAIVNMLLMIADVQQTGHPGEALYVLLCITYALHQRLAQLFSIDLIHKSNMVSIELKESYDEMNAELEYITGKCINLPQTENALPALRQAPAPIFALDVSLSVLSTMLRSIVMLDSNENEALSKKDLNTCVNLIDSLIQLLLDCVTQQFWVVEHSSKTHKDMAHKSCMLMRTLGELLTKYRKSFSDNPERAHHRVAWLRLILCAEKLLSWAKQSPLPPASLIVALQSAQLDPALELLYPELSRKINDSLLASQASLDQEHKNKYKALNELFVCMDYAVQFMKNKNINKKSREVLIEIKNCLPVLGLFNSEAFLKDIANILLYKSKDFNFDQSDWSVVKSIVLKIMAHNLEWVKVKFYQMLAEMVKSILFGDEVYQTEHEECLVLLCDVGVLTEICCHGLSSNIEEVNACASEIMLYLLRGRLVLSESCWWRLLASLLPILPLLHVYAEHDTHLGKAICKSLEPDIVDCMGVSVAEMVAGLTRLLFVRCVAVQLEAAHALCRLLDDDRYLPPRESLRSDLLLNAVRRLEPQDFNMDSPTSLITSPQTAGLIQILEVLKQDLSLDEDGAGYVANNSRPTLEPSLRRSTLQQLSVLLRQQDSHEAFLQHDGLNLILALLRMSLMIDDYLAFPECAISCVSILNSVCYVNRHNLAKITDLSLLLLRVILVFPSNDSCVLMSAQIMSLIAWSGFALQEINSSRQKVPALPLCVTERTSLPFAVNSYWNTSPNAEHSSLEWLQSDDEWRRAIRVRWWCSSAGGVRAVRCANPRPPATCGPAASLRLAAPLPAARDLSLLRAACVVNSTTKYLLALENATSHSQVMEALSLLESYTPLVPLSALSLKEYSGLPWQHLRRFLCAPPASCRDVALLTALLQFLVAYMDSVPADGTTMNWIKPYFIGNDVTIITLLSRERLYPQQTPQEDMEVTQLHIHIVKIIWRCIKLIEYQDDYDVRRMESLLKILFSCLDKIDSKNFHMLGYRNELIRCIRYALYSRYCKLSEDSLLEGLKAMTKSLFSCGTGSGRKGQGCKLDAMLALLAMLRQIHEEDIPAQRWSEVWSGDVVHAVIACGAAERAELRAAGLHVMAALSHYTQLRPQLMQSIPNESLSHYAMDAFLRSGEANVVRASAASLLAAIAARSSPHSDVLENDIIEQLTESDFLESCLQIFVDFCNEKDYQNYLKPNVPMSVLERRSELEVLAEKNGNVCMSPSVEVILPPPTPDLVVAVADVLHNVSGFKSCPVNHWNDQGLYRFLFRCASWSCGTVTESYRVRAATCRALASVATRKCVRASLAATKDCLVHLLLAFTSRQEEICDEICISSRTQTLSLLAALLPERSASDTVWSELRERWAPMFFRLLTQSLESDDDEQQDAAMNCLTQLTKSALHRNHADKTSDESFVEFFNDFKYDHHHAQSVRSGAGDIGMNDDCQPEYVCEELCKLLIYRFQDIFDKKKYLASQDAGWIRVCSCLSFTLSVSLCSRLYAVHRQFPRVLLAAMQSVRDQLSLQGKPVDVIRNANHDPVLFTLFWLLTIINCLMLDCRPAKESFADNITGSLNKLWPWCMMTEQLRSAIMHLLVTFTNDCPKAWACMCACVGGRSALGELCTLLARSGGPQLLALTILRQCVPHHHCRSILLKSDVLSYINKVISRGGASEQCTAWLRLCEALARHADGSGALLALPALRPAPARLLPALAHAAHHHRATFLQAPDLLELLSAALLTGNTSDVVLAARAVWALAANNHRSKLVLRSAGVAAAVQSALQRYQRAGRDANTQALQLLTYTNTVLQTT